MPVLPAAFLVAVVAIYYVIRTSTKVPATVTFAKPTTVIPAATAIFAAVAAVAAVAITWRAEVSPLWVLGSAAAVGFVILRIGGTTAGNRVVYDRGGVRLPPGKLFGVALVAVVCFIALIERPP